MFKSLIAILASCLILLSSFCFADCCQSVQVGVGWRRDSLDWKLKDLTDSCINAKVDSHIHFKKMDSYTVNAKAMWANSAYYIRLSADYGLSDKGRAKERFRLFSTLIEDGIICVQTNDPIKRRSETYDFDGAVGYPLDFCNCRLNLIPLIGFSYHRQRMRVKGEEHCSSLSSYCDDSCGCFDDCFDIPCGCTRSRCSSSFSPCCSSSYFSIDSSCNPFLFPFSSNPFSEPSARDPFIASKLGLETDRRTSNYRFTWYGFYIGADIAYALDSCWTLFTEIEYHFLDRCHRKRESWTGVHFVDDYHHEGWAYGLNTVLGTTVSMASCWFAVFTVDYKWWKGNTHHDKLEWWSVGINASLAYSF